jgi:hypothetical protein
MVGDERRLLLSGGVHYWRVPPQLWSGIFKGMASAGLNCVETYVNWGIHEPERGVFDFEGIRDLQSFIRQAGEAGLMVVLRAGPYICAEVNYGGFPAWLREVPGIELRTANPQFLECVSNWFDELIARVAPLVIARGGAIALVQIENEYGNIAKHYPGAAGYMKFLHEKTRRAMPDVPLFVCDWERFEWGQPTSLIYGINSFYADRELEPHWKSFPTQPGFWVENWTGWYNTFGHVKRWRSIADLASAVARFIVKGGSAVNYYMWHGGTNFGREGMYLQTPYYDFDAPCSEHGELSTKGKVLQDLHSAIRRCEADIISVAPEIREHGGGRVDYHFGDSVNGTTVSMSPWPENLAVHAQEGQASQVRIKKGELLVFDLLESISNHASLLRHPIVKSPAVTWKRTEVSQICDFSVKSLSQSDLLSEIGAGWDYVIYQRGIDSASERECRLSFAGISDFARLYVNDKEVPLFALPLIEARGKIDSKDFGRSASIVLAKGKNTIRLLVSNLGMIKGDWSLGYSNMRNERKGIWGDAYLDNQALDTDWYRSGPIVLPHDAAGACKPLGDGGGISRPVWYQCEVPVVTEPGPLYIDLGTMSKGVAYLGDSCAFRYWSIPQMADVSGAPLSGLREPTQRFYRLPEHLLDLSRTLILIDELGARPDKITFHGARYEKCSMDQLAEVLYFPMTSPVLDEKKASDLPKNLTATMTGINSA